MTYVTTTSRAPIRDRLARLSAAWAERRARDRAYRTTVAELSAMSARELNDIGIDRADIGSIAGRAAYGA